jgi:hypothetical protein
VTLIVEDGNAVDDANAYVSVADAVEYAAARGLAFSTSPDVGNEAAIIRATAAIDATYRGRFPGYKRTGRAQNLEWPRGQAYDVEGLLIDPESVPIEIINATCEMAVRELANPGSMMPDLDRGGNVRRLKAGSVEIEYGANASARTEFTLIDGMLTNILTTGSGGGLFGVAVRG